MENHIMWHYIDTRKASISAIADYPKMVKMKSILSNDQYLTDGDNYSRMRQINAYLCWFEPAWLTLSEEKRKILEAFYMTGNFKSGAGISLQFELHYSERQIYRIKEHALDELANMLFVLLLDGPLFCETLRIEEGEVEY